MENSTKEGNFDWIFSFDQFKHYFERKYIGDQNFEDSSLLDIGCGTSTFSLSLFESLMFKNLLCIDYDDNCISHMRSQFSKKYGNRVQWERYDLMEDFNTPNDIFLNKAKHFDIIVDKGTFDALLVGGSVSSLLRLVKKVLKNSGIYIIFSIFDSKLLNEILSIKELDFKIRSYALDLKYDLSNQSKIGAVYYIENIGDPELSEQEFINVETKEKSILDTYYKDDNPLLSLDFNAQIKSFFEKNSDPNGFLDIKTIHEQFFSDLVDYTYDLFMDDLSIFDSDCQKSGKMNFAQTINFLSEMQ